MKSHTDYWPEYEPQSIEPKWQLEWENSGIYQALDSSALPKYYCLDFFPYPSGEGLHVGHCRNYIPTDVISRFMRMRGYNVLHPMGWDAFGEPTEQHAISSQVHPRKITDLNTANYRRQMTMIGASYDWSREIDSSNPDFYRWTQWIFLFLYKRGLAYRDTSWQWWCPVCQTTLSSHEVSGGVCWRGHKGVTKKEIPAWYFRITAYADELLAGLEDIDWPEAIKSMQRNWIGRSEGCEIIFHTQEGETVPVFTTRPDTLFGATFFVLAPEHPLVYKLTTEEQRDSVEAYVAQAISQSEIERLSITGDKSGVFTGGYVLNPLNQEKIPVWIADYVLMSYGTGAVMGVPAHDQRDFEFAQKYDLPVKIVIAPPGRRNETLEMAYVDPGIMINSGIYDGQPSEQCLQQVCKALAMNGLGGPRVQYKMRDWLISRQRYWGTPIPIVYCENCGEVPLPEDDLPVLLPEISDYTPDGSGHSPLARVPEFVSTNCPECGGAARREVDTMGGFACSSWYFLRFTSPHYDLGLFEPEAMRYWMPVDLYVGGAEHAVLHLLYSRFWIKALADGELLSFREPFTRLVNQGQLLAPDGQRMSKSRGNVITPDAIVEAYGADSLRIYEMFMAPFDQDIPWNTDGINGARRFLNRTWNLVANTYKYIDHAYGEDLELEQETHKLIRRVTDRIEGFRFNTMVSALMEYLNFLYERYKGGKWQTDTFRDALDVFMVMLAPAAPHIAEEMWLLTDHMGSVHEQVWPEWDDALAQEKVQEIAVQVDGKLRAVIPIPSESDQELIEQIACTETGVIPHLAGREIIKVIYIPGRILNFVTKTISEERS